jgi:type IV pilus assembly protein PilQ
MKIKYVSICFILCLSAMNLNSAFAQQMSEVLQTGSTDKQTSLILNNADIQGVLRLIAAEYDLNIVMSQDVTGKVSLRLKGASLVNTLDAVLLSRGFDYEIKDNIIRVASAETIENERNQRLAKRELDPLVPTVIKLSYLDSNDVIDVVRPMLTARGTVEVLAQRGYSGFGFGGGDSSSSSSSGDSGSSSGGGGGASGFSGLVRERDGEEEPRSNTLLVVDVLSQIEKIKAIIKEIDSAPRQILIDSKILEVDTTTLDDLGLDFNSDASFLMGNESDTATFDSNSAGTSSSVNAGAFGNTFPSATDAGFHLVFQKLKGEDINLTLHALRQDSRTKTLSAPKILTVENQEATILVGEQFPIFEANVTDQGTTTESLSYFQPVGVSLQVIAQTTPDDDVTMIIHPSVSSIGAFVTGTSGLVQPRINIREADTRVFIENGETLVLGGLLQDVVTEREWGIPVLKDLPYLGDLFTRKQSDVDQRNLIMFITPTIIDHRKVRLSKNEKVIFEGIDDPAAYGYLHERRQMLKQIFSSAEKNYDQNYLNLAKSQFLRILAIDPHHEGAIKYLKKMDALPTERPV